MAKCYHCLLGDLMDGRKPAASVWNSIADLIEAIVTPCWTSSLSGQLIAIGGKEFCSIDCMQP